MQKHIPTIHSLLEDHFHVSQAISKFTKDSLGKQMALRTLERLSAEIDKALDTILETVELPYQEEI